MSGYNRRVKPEVKNLNNRKPVILAITAIPIMKIESTAGSPPPTSIDLCCRVGRDCFAAALQVKPSDGFGKIGVFLACLLYSSENLLFNTSFNLLFTLKKYPNSSVGFCC
ncbi:hypothetical protein AVEN_232400-1 [Araneus ventricosus]|uniref:Uncharacterized protein n=1 Tax=Araneus ventricosus TaxID=182803 RepID=A0A4Y2CVJ4_ARAVE|nr:hypothetical protein AVEN_232400-1 [Araneus ventricosus]